MTEFQKIAEKALWAAYHEVERHIQEMESCDDELRFTLLDELLELIHMTKSGSIDRKTRALRLKYQ